MNEYVYRVEGTRPVPQGRPKFRVFKKGKAFIVGKPYYGKTSKSYRELLLRTIEDSGIPPEPLVRVMVFIEAHGLRTNADPDNLAKQVLDALVTAKVLKNDTCAVIRRLIVDCYPLAKKAQPRLEIRVSSLDFGY